MRVDRTLRSRCRVHKPRVPRGPNSLQRFSPADNIANKRATHGPAQIPRRQTRTTIQSLTERPGRGGTATAFDFGPPLRPERSLRSPARLRTAPPTRRPGQTLLPTPTRVSDQGCAKPLLTALLRLARSEPTDRGRPLGKDRETDGESKAGRTSQTAIPGTVPCTPTENSTLRPSWHDRT